MLVFLIVIVLGIFYYISFVSKTETLTLDGAATEKNMIKNGVDFSDGNAVEVIDYDGHYLLVKDLHVGQSHPPHATGPGCAAQHWHADGAVTAVNDGTTQSDPLSGGCGFGTLTERPVMNYFPNELLTE